VTVASVRKRVTVVHPERIVITASVRSRIMERDGFRCRRCGNGPADARLVIDHIVPIALGGKSTDGNLQTLCDPCNAGKAARPPHPHDFIS
jgi:5-methylcytosine-specific restriction endonuclease McrA